MKYHMHPTRNVTPLTIGDIVIRPYASDDTQGFAAFPIIGGSLPYLEYSDPIIRFEPTLAACLCEAMYIYPDSVIAFHLFMDIIL